MAQSLTSHLYSSSSHHVPQSWYASMSNTCHNNCIVLKFIWTSALCFAYELSKHFSYPILAVLQRHQCLRSDGLRISSINNGQDRPYCWGVISKFGPPVDVAQMPQIYEINGTIQAFCVRTDTIQYITTGQKVNAQITELIQFVWLFSSRNRFQLWTFPVL